jgi:hypothetical protein
LTKKAKVTIRKEDDTKLDEFYSKTLTKELNKLAQGTRIKLSIQEDQFGDQFVGDYVVKGITDDIEEIPPVNECPQGYHWDQAQQKCIIDVPPQPPTCPTGEHWDQAQQKCVPDAPIPEPPKPTGEVLYDSTIHSKLHDGKVRTVDSEGSITPNGLGVECRASGSPKCQVNADKTFSLLCGVGHGRFYFYVLNYDATLEIEAAWWKGDGDCSLKMQSRHNEGGDCANRFGGYGLSIDRTAYNAKRETCHNVHDQSNSGKLPQTLKNQEYWKVEFTVKHDDANTKAVQTGKLNGKLFMTKTDSSPEKYMLDKASFAKQSYLWVRSNVDSGSGELRIKRLRILKA